MNVVLISTYELGHQPFGLASPAAWLSRAGHAVTCIDLAAGPLLESSIKDAALVAFSLPMHTATRLAIPVIERVKRLNPAARIACYGLYAPLNAELLRGLGVEAIAGGEFEEALVAWAGGAVVPNVSLNKLTFMAPERSGLAHAERYAKLRQGSSSKLVAYTEASRGCKHLCRHCPVVPVYKGQFRVVQRDVVLDDIRQQVASGATHVTFGDPDFFNGPAHAMRIVEALHAEFPDITFDATIKVEHLLARRDLLRPLRHAGCLFVTSAVESLDDTVLAKLEKNHTRADFIKAATAMREAGLEMQPTFIAFTPWTTAASHQDLLRTLRDLELVENTGSVQLALRLLITNGSRLLELDDIRTLVRPFDRKLLVYPWTHPDPAIDALAARTFRTVGEMQKTGASRSQIFSALWDLAFTDDPLPRDFHLMPRATVPYLDEPWYC